MDLRQLRCFIAVAEELHFGRAARRLDMLPSALGRHVRLLEESLGTALLLRTTRNVMLSQDGTALLDEARSLIAKADELGRRFREHGRKRSRALRPMHRSKINLGSKVCDWEAVLSQLGQTSQRPEHGDAMKD